VAILEKAPRFAARQRHRFLAAARELEQAAAALAARRRDGARAEEIAGSQIAAVGGMMRDHLRRRPIEVPRIAGRQAMRREARFAHRLGLDQQIERDVESARRLIVLVEQGGKRRRIAGCGMRNGASASVVTIQGEMLVWTLFARNGPSG